MILYYRMYTYVNMCFIRDVIFKFILVLSIFLMPCFWNHDWFLSSVKYSSKYLDILLFFLMNNTEIFLNMKIYIQECNFVFVLVVLGFELRASHLLSRCSVIWAAPPILSSQVILEIGSHFLPKLAWNTVLLFYTSCWTWDDRDTTMPRFFLVRCGLVNFLPGLTLNCSSPSLHLLGNWDYGL
jgi:hypothetical protein